MKARVLIGLFKMRSILNLASIASVLLVALVALPALAEDSIAPDLFIELEPPRSIGVGQGRTLVILVRTSEPLSRMEAIFQERSLEFYPTPIPRLRSGQVNWGNLYRAIIGIPLNAQPGNFYIYFEAKDLAGNVTGTQRVIGVAKTYFVREHLSITPGRRKYLAAEPLAREAARIETVLKETRPEQLWEGKFIMPVQGRISSPYGAYRLYYGGEISKSGRHKGVDIANQEGTEIFAPHGGVVVLSEPMQVHGQTIIIDHGQGIFSILCHLKHRLVEQGQKVAQGQLVGLLGQTGLATGPHLHWGLSVDDIRVDPIEWTKRVIGSSGRR